MSTPRCDAPGVAVTADVVTFRLSDDRLVVLLVRRRYPPFEGRWVIPGGFVEIDETLEEAARRELVEETGLSGVWMEQVHAFGDPQRDPRMRVITVAFLGAAQPDNEAVRAGDDAADARWFALADLPVLGFDHDRIVARTLAHLRYNLLHSAVGFHFLRPAFTLTELQRLHEIVLEQPLDKRNFRRRVLQAGIVEETGGIQTGTGRPARLYRLRPGAEDVIAARRLFVFS